MNGLKKLWLKFHYIWTSYDHVWEIRICRSFDCFWEILADLYVRFLQTGTSGVLPHQPYSRTRYTLVISFRKSPCFVYIMDPGIQRWTQVYGKFQIIQFFLYPQTTLAQMLSCMMSHHPKPPSIKYLKFMVQIKPEHELRDQKLTFPKKYHMRKLTIDMKLKLYPLWN